MPIKAVKPDVAKAITDLVALLKRDYGCDYSYSYSVCGRGFVLAQSNIHGVNHPVPLVEASPESGWNSCIGERDGNP